MCLSLANSPDAKVIESPWLRTTKLMVGVCSTVFVTAAFGQAVSLAPSEVSPRSQANRVQSSSANAPAVSRSEVSEAVSSKLASIRKQIRAGAMELALSRLSFEAPPVVANADWHAWALQRWNLQILLKRWDALKQTIQAIPPGFPQSFKDEADIYRARAMMELGEATKASLLVRAVLASKDLSADNLQAGRSLLIDIYLRDGDFDNAQIEATRFNDEFKPQDSDWFIQRALIALSAQQAENAINILAPIAASQAKLLQAYARILDGSMTTQQAVGAIKRVLGKKRVAENIKHFGEAVLVFALNPTRSGLNQTAPSSTSTDSTSVTTIKQDWYRYIVVLEQYLMADAINPYSDLIDYNMGDLLDAYAIHADIIVNQAQLLSSDSHTWYTMAARLLEAKDNKSADRSDHSSSNALSLYIAVRSQSDDEALRIAAMNKAIRILLDDEKPRLIARLFGETDSALGSFEGIESILASRLVNYGLLSNDTTFVASLAPYIGIAPESVNEQDWLIQKARIDIFTGRFDSASSHIKTWLQANAPLDGGLADRILQLVFDLQAIDKHDYVLALLDEVRVRTNSAKHQREILYWKAESFEATGELREAANFYTQSALSGDNSFDDWGQSARFHAADMLTKLGYYADAERLYRGILRVTKDAARLDTIRQALQQLWLLQQG